MNGWSAQDSKLFFFMSVRAKRRPRTNHSCGHSHIRYPVRSEASPGGGEPSWRKPSQVGDSCWICRVWRQREARQDSGPLLYGGLDLR